MTRSPETARGHQACGADREGRPHLRRDAWRRRVRGQWPGAFVRPPGALRNARPARSAASGSSACRMPRSLRTITPRRRSGRSAITSMPMASSIRTGCWRHLEASNVTFRVFDDKDLVSDQQRADRFIAELQRPRPPPNSSTSIFRTMGCPRPGPRTAIPTKPPGWKTTIWRLGRILDSLSHSPWWPETAVFVTESNTDGGSGSHRFPPDDSACRRAYVKRNYVSHSNSNFPGLLRTVFELLHVPPMTLADATAASLRGMFDRSAGSDAVHRP